ncbi:related to YPT7 - GTP-binding protein of the RAB family [Melanopsichium pennsylvanicum]|uniref:Related to YPT7 - GTP-binding protein of the RAB family n=2 Tax=Melanopsichium pennsylvanicum TaxID=63383 RepID=A0AAJ5C634_9BASI|nr:related to YPT7-GTP-binding protein of the RAB family [Melanopsichium pennsylvanicum 4]SNX85183.1 related to YPT7 - GTP-binding protein of the RAB family [Melanopsichium pennsylvanicum]
MPAKIIPRGTGGGRDAGPSTSSASPRKPSGPASPTMQRQRSGGDAASALQSSAVAAIGSIRTLASISSSSTSLHPITPKRAIKVVLIGDGNAGKTSIRNRFLTDTFYPSYRATIGADFITKTVPVDPLNPDGEKATLQIWDTAGQERFQSLGSAFYRGADAVILAFDVTKGEEALERVEAWFRVFMEKAPGPSDDGEKARFTWICAGNKSDLLSEEGAKGGVQRERVREVLDRLVERSEGQVDWGLDKGEDGVRPSGAEEPANPAEVLSRPDPNGAEQTPRQPATPDGTRGPKSTGPTPLSLKNLANGSVSASKTRVDEYKLSRKSLNSIVAKAKSHAVEGSDADEAQVDGGTVNTMYATPYNTMSALPQLSNSPTAKSDATRQQDNTMPDTAGSGFLSSWMSRSKSKASTLKPNAGGRRHDKRQSIKSIEVFQVSDQEIDSDASTSGTADRRFAFPSSGKNRATQTPPRSTRTDSGGLGAVSMKDRQRVDSTMSLNAPSVYHTPRSSLLLGASPTPRATLGIPSSGKDDGSMKYGHGRNQSNASSLRIDSTHDEGSADSGSNGRKELKHKQSIASSTTLSVATVKPHHGRTRDLMLGAPKSINDLFQPNASMSSSADHSLSVPMSPPLSPPPPKTPSTISLPIEPLPPPPAVPGEIETGFTLFYTSAKTGHNVERMFRHIVHRVVTSQAYEASLVSSDGETEEERNERERREAELMRRTIRLASGKNPDSKWLGCC